MNYHLAQINIAHLIAPLDDPRTAGFVAQLDAINALADRSPGFIWRLKTDDGASSTYVRAFDDERILVNMSVWESVEVLKEWVYRSGHGAVYRDRRQWFEPMSGPPFALWWIPEGSVPTVQQGLERLELLKDRGPTQQAFTFKQPFPHPQ